MSLIETLIELTKVATPCLAIVLTHYLQQKKEAKKKAVNNDMDAEYERVEKVTSILEEIREITGSDRVFEVGFSNGDVTFAGVHLKKLSVVNESHIESLEDLAPHFQLVPAKKFKRNLDAIRNAPNDWTVSKEYEMDDELATLNKMFGLTTLLMVSIRNVKGKWIGVLGIAYDDQVTEITNETIAYAKLGADRIGMIESK